MFGVLVGGVGWRCNSRGLGAGGHPERVLREASPRVVLKGRAGAVTLSPGKGEILGLRNQPYWTFLPSVSLLLPAPFLYFCFI